MVQEITSSQNPRIKSASLLHQARQRQQQERFLVDGTREIGRALEAGWPLEEVFSCDQLLTQPAARALRDQLLDAGIPLLEITRPLIDKLAYGRRSEGIVAVARRLPLPPLDQLVCRPGMLLAILEAVEKPGNLGAIIRSADAAGIDGVILANRRTDPFNPNAIRASTGTVFGMPLYKASSEETLAWLGANDFQVLATQVDGSISYLEIDWRGRAAVILGEEVDGLSSCWSDPAVTPVAIPMRGRADSLNVSTTAAIIFYEALRQR